MLIIHIFVALLSLVFSSVTYFRPSARKIQIGSAMVGATLASGTYLVLSRPVHILSTCISGLVYVAAVGTMLSLAKYRLSRLPVKA